MRYFPLFIDTQKLDIVLLGGQTTAESKLRLLLKSESKIQVYSPNRPDWTFENHDLYGTDNLSWIPLNSISELPWTDIRLLYCALEEDELTLLEKNESIIPSKEQDKQLLDLIRELASQHKVLLNVVDQKELCDVITPSIVDRDPVVVAISTAGKAPMLGRKLRKSLEERLHDHLGSLVSWAGELRKSINQTLPMGHPRRLFWGSFFDGSVAHSFYNHGQEEAQKKVEALLSETLQHRQLSASSEPTLQRNDNQVVIMGAGPGDPKLLTLEAIEAIENADVLLIDRLVDQRILKYCRREAQLIYVGKNPNGPSINQTEINRLLIQEAQKGHQVVRLKGGDPMIFGRVVEEMEVLENNNIPYRLLAGLSAAQVGATQLKIPLTRRGIHRQCIFATGHSQTGLVEHPWTQWAQSQALFALYMSAKNAGQIQERLLNAQFDPNTPVTIVSWVSRPQQRALWGTLSELDTLVQQLRPDPMILYIGAHPYDVEHARMNDSVSLTTLESA